MAVKFSRSKPSPRYERLLRQYQIMHREGESHLGIPPDRTFPGKSLPPQAPRIKRLIDLTGARDVLDYGSVKGQQYMPMPLTDDAGVVYPDIRSWWGVTVRCYDPAYPPHAELPEGEFDGVVCTEVLEHCPEEDMEWIVGELFGYARRFVFANVACFPAQKRLPSGQNAHCTVRPVKWWRALIESAARRRPRVLYEFRVTYDDRTPDGPSRVEGVLTNEAAWQAASQT
jgi:hypothetical protein